MTKSKAKDNQTTSQAVASSKRKQDDSADKNAKKAKPAPEATKKKADEIDAIFGIAKEKTDSKAGAKQDGDAELPAELKEIADRVKQARATKTQVN